MEKNIESEVSYGDNLWQIADSDERFAELIVQKYNLPYIMAKIIALRGVHIDEVESYLAPKISNMMPDPYVLKDIYQNFR